MTQENIGRLYNNNPLETLLMLLENELICLFYINKVFVLNNFLNSILNNYM